jgi:hypothetical protein
VLPSDEDGNASRGCVMVTWMVVGIVLLLAVAVCGFLVYIQLQREEM